MSDRGEEGLALTGPEESRSRHQGVRSGLAAEGGGGPIDTTIDFDLGSVTAIGGGIVFNGGTTAGTVTLTTTDDSVRFNGAVTLASDVSIDTGAGDGRILFTQFAPVDSAIGSDLVFPDPDWLDCFRQTALKLSWYSLHPYAD